MLFRIEDTQGSQPNLRQYMTENFHFPCINTNELDGYIAKKIKAEINGSKQRELLSYSKSLATCLLKYNQFCDNDLHIYLNSNLNYISYLTPEDYTYFKTFSTRLTALNYSTIIPYSLQNASSTFFEETCPKIHLCHFIIDVSNNQLVNNYLIYYTGTAKKCFASPEKDSEVVVMNPLNDAILSSDGYLSSVYLLYALQMKYHFLYNVRATESLINSICNLDYRYFQDCPNELNTLVYIIQYLASNWKIEYELSKKIYCFNHNIIPTYYDPASQFNDILYDSFLDSYDLRSYNDNVVSELIWRCCAAFLGYDLNTLF